MAGRCGLAGHAVNPSQGARWRHPWRQRSCQPTPPHPRQISGDGGRSTPCVDESPLKSNISTIWRRASTHGVDLRVDQGRHPPTAAWSTPTKSRPCIPTDRGDLSKAGWVRLRGARSVRGMDAAAKPPRMGLRRPPQPDPPRLPTGNPLLLRLLLFLRLPASGRHYCGCRAAGPADQPTTWQQRSAFRCRRQSPGQGSCAPACPADR